TGRIAPAVAQPFDLVDDRDLRIAGQDEIAMDRMRQPAFDGAAGRDHGLPDHLTAEHPLPARLRAVAAEQVYLELFEIEDGNEVDEAFGHDGAFDRFRPQMIAIPDVKYLVCPPCFAQLISGSKRSLT